MLQYSREPTLQVEEPEAIPDVPFAPEPSIADHLGTLLGFVRRQFPIVLAALPLTIGLALAYLYTTPPLYTAEARILIDTGKIQVSNQPIFGDAPINMALVDSQIEVLKSDSFALSVIKSFHLTEDPQFSRSRPGLLATAIGHILHPFGAAKVDVEHRVLAAFEKRLAIYRVGLTYVIGVEFQSSNPDSAAEIANAIADAYVHDQLQSKYETIGKATAWLQDRLNELRTQASAAEHAVVDYKTKHNIIDTGGRLINEQQLSELNTALVKARADTVEAKARLDRVSQIINNSDIDPATAEVATVADALRNEVISKLRERYLELAQRQALLTARLGQDHLAVVNIRNQMGEVRHSIFDEFKRIAEAYKSDYDIAKARENSLQASLATTAAGSQTTNTAQIELRQLESSAQSYRSLYNNFQQRYTDFVQQQSFPVMETQITRALPPTVSSSPKAMKILALATFGGLALGFGLGLLRELSDRVFRTSNQVEARLRTECVAMLPLVKGATKKTPPVVNPGVTNLKPVRIVANPQLLHHVIDLPLSQFSEGIRAIKVAVDLSGGSKSRKVIGITSALPEEGKSTISASLAQLCAHSGARVVLVDCDLRKRSLSQDLAPKATVGLIEVLTDTATLDDVLWSDPATNLSFLPAVVRSRLTHTSEILASAAMNRLFNRLRESYDYVIVDLSPVVPIVDVRAATHLVDTYLFIVEWGKTRFDVVERALTASRGVYENLLGVILNKVDFVKLGRYDYSTYHAQYGYYGYQE